MLTKKAATAVNYFEYFSPTPHAVQYSAHCSEDNEDRRRLCQEDRQKYRAAFDRQQPHKKHKNNSNNNEREYKTCWKHKYWQHTRMLPQTVKLFRFMNINAHPPAKGGGVGCGSSAGRVWRGGRGATTKGQPGNTEHSVAFKLQLQLHSKHGAIVVVVLLVVLVVIDSRTSLPHPLAPSSCCCSSSAQAVLQLVALFLLLLSVCVFHSLFTEFIN